MEMNKRAGGGQEGKGNDFQFLGELYKQLNEAGKGVLLITGSVRIQAINFKEGGIL